MVRCAVDDDIQPASYLESCVEDGVDLSFGIGDGEDAAIDALSEADGLFTTSRVPVTQTVLESVPDLDLVAKIGTGLDSIDLDAARQEGVTVVYTPGSTLGRSPNTSYRSCSPSIGTCCSVIAASRRVAGAI